jgi:hypothetical protein
MAVVLQKVSLLRKVESLSERARKPSKKESVYCSPITRSAALTALLNTFISC